MARLPASSLILTRGAATLLALCAFSTAARAGAVTGIENNITLFNFNFNNSFELGASGGNGSIWQGTYREDVNHFTLDMYAGPSVDFNHDSSSFDTYKLNIESLWTVKLTVSIRDNALFSNDDVFRLDGAVQHTSGENLPHAGDSAKGELYSIGFSDVKVADLKPGDLTTIKNPTDPLLGGIQGSYWQYHATGTVGHPTHGHQDTYNVYFLANVDTETNAQSGYRILISGTHAVPEPGTWALLLGGLGIVGMRAGALRYPPRRRCRTAP